MSKEVEEAKKRINRVKEYIDEDVSDWIKIEQAGGLSKDIETILKYIEELEIKNKGRIIGKYGDITLDKILKDKYISKDKIKELLNKNKEKMKYANDELNYSQYTIYYQVSKVLQELLQEK